MRLPSDKTSLLVTSSRSSVTVKYQSHSFQKKWPLWGINVSQTHLVGFVFDSRISLHVFVTARVLKNSDKDSRNLDVLDPIMVEFKVLIGWSMLFVCHHTLII